MPRPPLDHSLGIQITCYLEDEDLTFLQAEQQRLQNKGAEAYIHTKEHNNTHALYRLPYPDEYSITCKNKKCLSTARVRAPGGIIKGCPRCGSHKFNSKPMRIAA